MGILNCWNWKNCGRYPGGTKAEELGVCPAATCEKSDGYLNGRGGGRTCAYVTGTFCGGKVQGSYVEKSHGCRNCDYYHALKKEYGEELNFMKYDEYCKKPNFNKKKTPASQNWVSKYKTGAETAKAARKRYFP